MDTEIGIGGQILRHKKIFTGEIVHGREKQPLLERKQE
jgi:hypothetical protein